jgi:hypothetical protein
MVMMQISGLIMAICVRWIGKMALQMELKRIFPYCFLDLSKIFTIIASFLALGSSSQVAIKLFGEVQHN